MHKNCLHACVMSLDALHENKHRSPSHCDFDMFSTISSLDSRLLRVFCLFSSFTVNTNHVVKVVAEGGGGGLGKSRGAIC